MAAWYRLNASLQQIPLPRTLFFLIPAGVIAMIVIIALSLRGCESERASPEAPEQPVSTESEDPAGTDDSLGSATASQSGVNAVSPGGSSGRSPSSGPRRSSDEPAPAAGHPAAAALSDARADIAAADRVSTTDPGEAFRLYADAYAELNRFPADAACAALAESLVPKLKQASAQANASADVVDGDKPLIEE